MNVKNINLDLDLFWMYCGITYLHHSHLWERINHDRITYPLVLYILEVLTITQKHRREPGWKDTQP